MAFIYALVHPETEEPYYVGKTDNLAMRYSQHLDTEPRLATMEICSSTHREPFFIVLGAYADENVDSAEHAWMNRFEAQGCKLDNAHRKNYCFVSDSDNFTVYLANGDFRLERTYFPMSQSEVDEALQDLSICIGKRTAFMRYAVDKSAGDEVSKTLAARYQ